MKKNIFLIVAFILSSFWASGNKKVSKHKLNYRMGNVLGKPNAVRKSIFLTEAEKLRL